MLNMTKNEPLGTASVKPVYIVHRGLHCLIWIWYEEGEIWEILSDISKIEYNLTIHEVINCSYKIQSIFLSANF